MPAGPLSHLYGNITTSCFNDTILVPLSTWIYFLLLPILYINARRNGPAYKPVYKRRCALSKDILYGFAVVVASGMMAIEVARLELANLGIGLLPFVWLAFLTAAFLRFSHALNGKFPTYWIAGVVLWTLLLATNAIKVVEMVKEGLSTRKGTKYPMSDEVTDVGVLLGVYLVLIGAEIWR
jgi:hypothetical protein